MTDYSEMIKRLRQLAFEGSGVAYKLNDGTMIWHPLYLDAADALEAQAREIERLEEANVFCRSAFLSSKERIAELEAANAVLSTRCQALFSLLPDEIKIGDIQKAVAKLKGERG